ncbi:MAG: type II toxin-antitoxin system HicB family antitoxin [Syntrophomonadaceae bacterium]|jgi:predicted RNase H-like HicB family nuclease|nr:type II toxin-antitoxin system HicB family antitoxin [Syntrophomonadaceae bacterium]
MIKSFSIAVTKEDDWFVAKCLENNVASQGKTFDESVDNLREAVALFYENEPVSALPRIYITTMEVAL